MLKKYLAKALIIGYILAFVCLLVICISATKWFVSVPIYTDSIYLKYECIIISFIYCIYIYLIQHINDFKISKVTVYLSILLCITICIIIYPTTSTDIFYYISYSIGEGYYKINPYTTSLSSLNSNLYPFKVMADVSYEVPKMTYGYIFAFYLKVLYFLSSGNYKVIYILIKFINSIGYIAFSILFSKISCKYAKVDFYKILLIVGLNPFMLNEFIINGHNDIFYCLLVLYALYLLDEEKSVVISFICLLVGFFIKPISGLVIPVLFIYTLKNRMITIKNFIACIWILFIAFVPNTILLNGKIISEGVIKYNAVFSLSPSILIVNIFQNKIGVILLKGMVLIFSLYYLSILIKYVLNKEEVSLKAPIKRLFLVYITFLLILHSINQWYFIILFVLVVAYDYSRQIKYISYITLAWYFYTLISIISFSNNT